jgi:hypothetical protein
MTKIAKADFVGLRGEIVHYWYPKNRDEIVVVNSWSYYGHVLVDIRAWHLKPDNKYHAGKGKRFRHAELSQLYQGLRRLRRFLESN